MIRETHLVKQLSFSDLKIDIYPAGDDIAVIVQGGEVPHIGCAVLAVPRKSLTGDGSISCTSSVINSIGHKDEALCRRAAEYLCCLYNVTVTCTGGFHQDSITNDQINELFTAFEELLQRLK